VSCPKSVFAYQWGQTQVTDNVIPLVHTSVPYAIYKEWQMAKIPTLRSMNNALREDANRLEDEVDVLSDEIDNLAPEADR
jgi:hypothetical protein